MSNKYRNIAANQPSNNEIFIIDIMREGIKNGDPRLSGRILR